jgi:hypothetical protein
MDFSMRADSGRTPPTQIRKNVLPFKTYSAHHGAADPIVFFAYASDRARLRGFGSHVLNSFSATSEHLSSQRETRLDEISPPKNLASVARRLIPSAFVQEIFTQKLCRSNCGSECMFAPAALFVFERSHFISAHFGRDELIEKM